MTRTVAVNESGRRVGQDHHRAKLTNRDVELIRKLKEDGMSVRKIAERFDVSTSTIEKISYYSIRNQFPTRFKQVTE
jgi:DNA-binding NarL/FixJ family response regulator